MQATSSSMWYDTPTLMPALIVALPTSPAGLWGRPAPDLLDEIEARLPGVPIGWAEGGREQSMHTAIAAARFHGASQAVVVAIWGNHHRYGASPQLPGITTWWTEAPPEVEAILTAYHSAVLAEVSELPVAV